MKYKRALLQLNNLKEIVCVEVSDYLKENELDELEVNFKNGNRHYTSVYLDTSENGELQVEGYEESEDSEFNFAEPVMDMTADDAVYLLKVIENVNKKK